MDGYLFDETGAADKDTSIFKIDSGGKHGTSGDPDYDKMLDEEYYKTVLKKDKKKWT